MRRWRLHIQHSAIPLLYATPTRIPRVPGLLTSHGGEMPMTAQHFSFCRCGQVRKALLLFSLAGCGDVPERTPETDDTNTATPNGAPATPAPPVGPSLWILIDRSPVPGDAELVQAIARFDPATGQQLDRIDDIGYNPRELAYADGRLCVHNMGYDAVTCVDPATHEKVHELEFDRGFRSYTFALGSIWALQVPDGLVRVDPATGARTAMPADLVPARVTSADNTLWVANTSMTVTRVDPSTNSVAASIPTRVENDPVMPLDIAAHANAVWVTTTGGKVLRIDPQTDQISAVIDGAAVLSETQVMLGARTRVAADDGGAWVAGLESGTVLRIDAASNTPTVAAKLEPPLHDITVGLGAVWVLHGANGTITRLDLAGSAAKVTDVGRGALGIVAQ